jgi:hypothetical protein
MSPGPQSRELHQKNSAGTAAETLCRAAGKSGRDRGFDQPISSEPAPSHRPWTLPTGATLPATSLPYHHHFCFLGKTGTFYFAQNRNFVLCVDTLSIRMEFSLCTGIHGFLIRDLPIYCSCFSSRNVRHMESSGLALVTSGSGSSLL